MRKIIFAIIVLAAAIIVGLVVRPDLFNKKEVSDVQTEELIDIVEEKAIGEELGVEFWIEDIYETLGNDPLVLSPKDEFRIAHVKWFGPQDGDDLVLEGRFLQKDGTWTELFDIYYTRTEDIYNGVFKSDEFVTRLELRSPVKDYPLDIMVEFLRYQALSD
jgi:hypothetical protein